MEEVKKKKKRSRCWKIVSALFSVCYPKMQIAFYQKPSSYILAWENLASIHASAERAHSDLDFIITSLNTPEHNV